MKILEKIANISLILGVSVFLVIVARGEFAKHSLPDTSPKALLGKTIHLPGVSFPQQHDSLVLALSTSCHFCKESLPFYKDLSEKSQGRLDVIAVLPQTESEAQTYVQDAAVKTTQVVSASLDTIGVYATPTLLLVDNNGKVQDAWVGLLDEKTQQKLLAVALPNK
jgi:thioredoxin-related protein